MSKKNVDRRAILRGLSLGAGAVGASSVFGGPAWAFKKAMGAPPTPGLKRILHINQRGGNDGINTLIPTGDGQYNTIHRENIHLGAGERIQLTQFAAVNLGLAALVTPSGPFSYTPWTSHRLAFIHRMGYPSHSRSHFESMQNMETAIHFMPFETRGWFNRQSEMLGFDMNPINSVGAVSISTDLMMAFNGNPALLHMRSKGGFRLDAYGSGTSLDYEKLIRVDETPPLVMGNRLAESYAHAGNPNQQWDAFIRSSGLVLADALKVIGALGDYTPVDTNGQYWTGLGPETVWPVTPDAATAVGLDPQGGTLGFVERCRDAIQLFKETDCQIAGVEIGGWDTHGQQKGTQEDLLRTVAHVLRSIYEDTRNGLLDDLVVVVETEFGRTSKENGSKGTDHGQASVMMMLGGPVVGGVHNCDAASWVPQGTPMYPSPMFDIEDRFLSHTHDYRDVRWDILDKHFGLTTGEIQFILPNHTHTQTPFLI